MQKLRSQGNRTAQTRVREVRPAYHKLKLNKNALSSVESCLLGGKIRNKEAIRLPAVVLLSFEPRAASEKVKLGSRPTVTQKKNKTARGLGGD